MYIKMYIKCTFKMHTGSRPLSSLSRGGRGEAGGRRLEEKGR